MADKDETEFKADAESGEKLDRLLSHVDAMARRMDAMEASEKERDDRAKKDAEDKPAFMEKKDAASDPEAEEAERVAADKRKDAEEEEAKAAKEKADADEAEAKEKEKADAQAKADAMADVQAKIARVESMIPKPMADEDRAAMTDAQAKADSVFAVFGDSAPRWLPGEDLMSYRRRLAGKLKEHSTAWKSVNLNAIHDAVAFDNVETAIYADAVSAAMNPTDLGPGQLRMITRQAGGHEIHEFAGSPRAWMDPIAGLTRQYVTSINSNLGGK